MAAINGSRKIIDAGSDPNRYSPMRGLARKRHSAGHGRCFMVRR
jgi:hypothetical protein